MNTEQSELKPTYKIINPMSLARRIRYEWDYLNDIQNIAPVDRYTLEAWNAYVGICKTIAKTFWATAGGSALVYTASRVAGFIP
jgi:hypothetical protein